MPQPAVQVPTDATVDDLKRVASQKLGIEVMSMYPGRSLEPQSSLSAYDLVPEAAAPVGRDATTSAHDYPKGLLSAGHSNVVIMLRRLPRE